MNKSIPVNGSWFNEEQPGTGYVFEFQENIFLGYYYGYNEEGTPIWYYIVGELVLAEDDPDIDWVVEASMASLENGQVINQAYQEPHIANADNQVRIEFVSQNYAKISVNGGEVQNIRPQIFGVEYSKYFEESDHVFPDLEGMWTFVFKRYGPEIIVQQSLYFSDIFYIDEADKRTLNDGTKVMEYDIVKYYAFFPFEIINMGSIICQNPINSETSQRQVVCMVDKFPLSLLGNEYQGENMKLPIGNLGAYKFTAEFTNPEFEESGLLLIAEKVESINR